MKRKQIAIDIETTGLYPVPGSKIFCCAVNDGGVIRVHTSFESLRKVLEDDTIQKVIHNAAFDSFWLFMLHGIEVKNIWDTELMERVLLGDNLFNPDTATEKQKLELSASLYYTLKRYKLPAHDKSMSYNFSQRDPKAPLTKVEIEYAKSDVRYLLQLQALQEVRLHRLNLTRVATLENKVVEVVVRMRSVGIGIDVKRWAQIEKENLTKSLNIQKRLPSKVSNWNSPAQVKLYFQSVGVPILSFDDITDEFRATYNNEVLNKFVEMREYSTYVSKYGVNFLWTKKKKGKGEVRYVVDGDNRIRANLFQILNTGRFSCSAPPLHGLPLEDEKRFGYIFTGAQHRSAFVSRKGYSFVGGDFSGQEIGIMAAASGEQLWIKALQRGEDPLSLMASIMFPDWSNGTEKGCVFPKKCKCKHHKTLRQISKKVTYGIAYGAYPKTISIKINRTKKETSKLMRKWRRVAPKLNRYLERNAAETVKTRVSYSADVYKRRRTVRDPQNWMVRNVGYNNPIQSCAANMMKLAMVSLNKKWCQVLPWHDDLILEVKDSQCKAASKELKIVMEKAADYCTGIPGLIKVDPRITKSLEK